MRKIKELLNISWWFLLSSKSLSGKSLDRIILIFQLSCEMWSFLILEHIVSKEDCMLIKAQLEGDSIVLKNTLFSFILTIYSSWKLAWDNDKFVKCRARKSLVHLSLMNCKIWTVTLRLHHESIIHRLCSPTLKFADQNPNVCRLSSRKVSKKFFVCLKPHARESSTLNR